jgi:hypothetical protein
MKTRSKVLELLGLRANSGTHRRAWRSYQTQVLLTLNHECAKHEQVRNMGEEAIQGGEMYDWPSSIICLQAIRSKKSVSWKETFEGQSSKDQAPFFFTRWSAQLIIHEGQVGGQPVTQDGTAEPTKI